MNILNIILATLLFFELVTFLCYGGLASKKDKKILTNQDKNKIYLTYIGIGNTLSTPEFYVHKFTFPMFSIFCEYYISNRDGNKLILRFSKTHYIINDWFKTSEFREY